MKEIGRKPEYFAESMALLYHIGSGVKYEKLRESLSRKYEIAVTETDSFQKKSELLCRIEKRAEAVFADDKELLDYYFCDKEDSGSCCGRLAVLRGSGITKSTCSGVTEWKEHLNKLREEEFYKEYGEMIQEYGKRIIEEYEEELKEPVEIIRYIMKMEIPMEEKWKLQDILLNHKQHQEKVLFLIEKAEGVLREYEKELNSVTEAFYDYWSKELEDREIEDYMKEVLSIDFPVNPLGSCLRPSVIAPNQMEVFSSEMEQGKFLTPDYMVMGIFFGKDIKVSQKLLGKENEREETALQILKLLSDKSKFEILAYTQKKAAYGSELAKHLDLTTATISHHMNALLTKGLVTIEREENKVFYRSNKKVVGEILDYCKKVLTGEERE